MSGPEGGAVVDLKITAGEVIAVVKVRGLEVRRASTRCLPDVVDGRWNHDPEGEWFELLGEDSEGAVGLAEAIEDLEFAALTVADELSSP